MESKIRSLVGQKVTKSSAGGSAGSILVLEFENTSYFLFGVLGVLSMVRK